MNARVPTFRIASDREAQVACPHCNVTVLQGDAIAVCLDCGSVHHQTCWLRENRCGSYDCAPAHREVLINPDTVLRISSNEINAIQPLPARRVFSTYTGAPAIDRLPRWNGWAIASLIAALAGIPLFGVVTGLVAVALGCIALGALRGSTQKGLSMALAGVILGLLDVVGWVIFLAMVLGGGGQTLHSTEFRPDWKAMENLDANINRAMRANVLVSSRLGFLRQEAIGSGVVLRLRDGEATVLTNRHVVDPDFSSESTPAASSLEKLRPETQFIDQSVHTARVVWLAPSGIDLALLRVPCFSNEVRAAHWRMHRPLRVGDAVFAIGNPHGFGWTHTQGTVSQFRSQELGGRRIRIIQTQTVINHGNSGGGLYDKDGYLIGITTWTQDKRVSEGLNFAISLDTLADFAVADLDVRTGNHEEPQQP